MISKKSPDPNPLSEVSPPLNQKDFLKSLSEHILKKLTVVKLKTYYNKYSNEEIEACLGLLKAKYSLDIDDRSNKLEAMISSDSIFKMKKYKDIIINDGVNATSVKAQKVSTKTKLHQILRKKKFKISNEKGEKISLRINFHQKLNS